MSAIRRSCLVLTCLSLSGLGAEGRSTLSITITPLMSFPPAQITLTARISRHADNRWLTCALLSDGWERLSRRQLDGESAPQIMQLFWKDVPAGEYTALAILTGSRGERARAETSFVVLSPQTHAPR